MNGFSATRRDQDWMKGFAVAIGADSASEVLGNAIKEFRKNHDIEAELTLREEILLDQLFDVWNVGAMLAGTISIEEAEARKQITKYISDIRARRDYSRELIKHPGFEEEYGDWLLENVCRPFNIKIEKARLIFKRIWAMEETR